jgi:hypothetical protein
MGTRVLSDPNIKDNWAAVPIKRWKGIGWNERSALEDEMTAWCKEHSKGRFSSDHKRFKHEDGISSSWEYCFFFKGVRDALMFKLTFGG